MGTFTNKMAKKTKNNATSKYNFVESIVLIVPARRKLSMALITQDRQQDIHEILLIKKKQMYYIPKINLVSPIILLNVPARHKMFNLHHTDKIKI
jgi:hypothetical protein